MNDLSMPDKTTKASRATKRENLVIGDVEILPGQRHRIELPVGDLYTQAPLTMPIEVISGRRDGPVLFVSAAIHGDEINGVEIVRRLLRLPALDKIRGTLITVPVVNVQGFLNLSRYLPDRRDLNRSFPGSERGSVAGRLAWLFAQEIVSKADCGIDLHTAAIHRTNLPQIRADLSDEQTSKLANAFGAPVVIDSDLRDGSLREYAASQGIPMLLYEAGEALRFDEQSIRAGVRGITNILRELGMLPARKPSSNTKTSRKITPIVARSSYWMRAERSGVLRPLAALGEKVSRDQVLGKISDPFGHGELEICARYAGIVIGRTQLPLVNEGDAIFHIARFESSMRAEQTVERFHEHIDSVNTEIPPIV